MNESLDDYYKILTVHLTSKNWKKYYSPIIFHLHCINIGCKPSFLWDIGPSLEITTLENIIQALKNASLLHSFIYLVLFTEEKFIINLATICKCLDDNLRCTKIIDCNSEFDFPIIIDSNNYVKAMCMINAVKEKLFNLFELHNEGKIESDALLDINFDENVIHCPPTIFGILLGYPVVYWAKDILKGNCLSNIPLCVYKIKTSDPLISEFRSECDVYSFSAPRSLNLDKFVENWVTALIDSTGIKFQLLKHTVCNSCIQL